MTNVDPVPDDTIDEFDKKGLGPEFVGRLQHFIGYVDQMTN
jgi:hypothetical protein